MPSQDFLALNPGYLEALPRNDAEHIEQVAFIRWATEHADRCPELAYIYAIPNGGKRDIATARKLKAEGVRAGYPDLALDVARGGWHGWRCEMKVKAGRVRPNQEAWHDWLVSQLYCVDVCWSWRQAAVAVCSYLGLEPREFGL